MILNKFYLLIFFYYNFSNLKIFNCPKMKLKISKKNERAEWNIVFFLSYRHKKQIIIKHLYFWYNAHYMIIKIKVFRKI